MRRRYFRQRRRNVPRTAAVIIIIILLTAFTIKTNHALLPVVRQQAEIISEREASDCISRAAARCIKENNYSYSDFSAVTYDEGGRLVSIEAITENINLAQSELAAEINSGLREQFRSSYDISLGSLTKSPILIGKGPQIKIRICPVGSAKVTLKSSFDSAGLNQTRHRIIAVADVKFTSSVPMYSFSGSAEFDFLLAETVIVGDVPDIARYAWENVGD